MVIVRVVVVMVVVEDRVLLLLMQRRLMPEIEAAVRIMGRQGVGSSRRSVQLLLLQLALSRVSGRVLQVQQISRRFEGRAAGTNCSRMLLLLVHLVSLLLVMLMVRMVVVQVLHAVRRSRGGGKQVTAGRSCHLSCL